MNARIVAVTLLLLASCTLYHRVVPRKPPTGVDLNHASPEAIAELPGLTEADAARIVEHRPYVVKDDVVRRGIVPRETFEAFADRVYVGRTAGEETGLLSQRRPTLLSPEEAP